MNTEKPATKNKRGPRKGQGGRPKGPEKVRLQCWILPRTRQALGDQPGLVIDTMLSPIIKTQTQTTRHP